MRYAFFYETPIGKIIIIEENDSITNIYMADKYSLGEEIVENTPLLDKAGKEVIEYLKGSRKEFTVGLSPKGTEFQNKVWNALKEIPYGKTASYKEVAIKIGNPKACRAIGMANNKNPILFIIPCHRVIGSSGKMVGYAAGMSIKENLLDLEKDK